MTTYEESYSKLNSRLGDLKEKRAVLVVLEQQKAAERDKLIEELTAAGVNVKDLDSEVIKLEKEAVTSLAEAQKAVDEFEFSLKSH